MKKTALAVVLLVAAVLGVLCFRGDTSTPKTTDRLVVNRFWVDHIPRHDRDLFQVFIMITQRPLGIFEVRSQWTGTFEAFRYEQHGNEVRAVFPQKGDRETFKIDAKECKRDGMDYCLEITGASRGVKQYYSREGWIIRPGATIDEIRATAETLLADPTSARK